ncbi:MAG TPA: AsmA-like C-terminal region-containing protein [Methylomirabilota bacterium]|nr:AsmA-like C-terminal region-containing protein [Methylomirabilota bacterium]
MKWLFVGIAAIVVLAVAALLLLPYFVDLPRVQALIASNASQALGRPVKFASMKITALPLPAVELRGLEVGDDPQFSKEPFVRLDTGTIRLKLWPLLRGRVELGDITLKKPVIEVVQAADGRLNVSTLGAGSEPTPSRTSRGGGTGGGTAGAGALAASKVTLTDGIVDYVAHGKGDAVTRYRLENVDVTLTGGATQLAFKGGFAVKPGDLHVKLADGTLAVGGARTITDAPLRGKVTLEAKDVGELARAFVGPSPQYGGGLNGALSLAGTLGAPSAAGEVTVTKPTVTQVQAACPEPKRRTLALGDLKLNAAYKDGILSGRPLSTAIGNGTIAAQLVASLERGVRVQVNDIGIKNLPLDTVLVNYLCQGYAITGPLDLTGALSFSAADLWNTLSGPGTLRAGPGKVVGPQALALVGSVVRVGGAITAALNADVPAIAAGSPLEFESITGNYQITNGVVTTRDLLYTSKAMKVGVAGQYALATGRMDADMTVTHGRGELKAKVTGNAASPSIRVDPATILRGVDREKVEKGLGDLLKKIR